MPSKSAQGQLENYWDDSSNHQASDDESIRREECCSPPRTICRRKLEICQTPGGMASFLTQRSDIGVRAEWFHD